MSLGFAIFGSVVLVLAMALQKFVGHRSLLLIQTSAVGRSVPAGTS